MMNALAEGSFRTSTARLSSRASKSSAALMPNSSNLRGEALWTSDVVALFEVEHERSKPPQSTVAVTACPPVLDVSTVMLDVPWPLVIVPAETVQWKVGVTFGSPPERLAVKVIGSPASTVSGPITLKVGQAGGGGHAATVNLAT